MSVKKPRGSELPVAAVTLGLFRPESIEARRMEWLGRPAVALGLPATLSSVASVLMVAAAVALVTFGSYARRVELHGMIVPSAGLIHVLSPAAGWVQSMDVRDGQAVAAGTPLYVVNTDTATRAGNTQQLILQALGNQRAMLVSQIARKVLLRDRRDAELRGKIENLQAQLRQLDTQMAMQDEFVRTVTNDLESSIEFQQQKIATLQERLARQESWMRAKNEFESLKSGSLRLQGQLIEAQAAQATNDPQIESEIDAMRAKIAELDQEVANSETRQSTEIRAPGAGTVTAIVSHPGQTVASGARMLTILPDTNTMQAELLAPSTAIGFLRPGQQVLLRYSAFPYQRFGEYPGTVSEVSHAALQPEELKSLVPGLPPSEQSKTFYRVIVKPERQRVTVSGRPEPLQASMQVDASVLLEKRPLYQLILQPLYDLRGA